MSDHGGGEAPSELVSDMGPFSMIPEWVLDHAALSDRAVRLYAVLARYADKDDGSCFPARSTLAGRLKCSVDSIDRALDLLIAAGAIVKQKRYDAASDSDTNLYIVIRGSRTGAVTWPHGCGDGGRTDAARGGRTGAAQNENQLELEPTNESDAAPSRKNSRANPFEIEFEEVWSDYPRKTAKKGARDAFVARRKAGVVLEELILAVKNYAAECERDYREQQFVLHGGTFFGAKERWKDFLTPPKPRPSRYDIFNPPATNDADRFDYNANGR